MKKVISQLFRQISHDRGQILRLHGDNSPVVLFTLKDNLKLPNSEGGVHMQVNGGPVFPGTFYDVFFVKLMTVIYFVMSVGRWVGR